MAAIKEFWNKKQHQRLPGNRSRVMQLGNGQLIVTLPKQIAEWKRARKGSVIRWEDGGGDRIVCVVEVVQ